MTAFPKYPKYKDSGLEWLGVVPEHWEISRSRRVFTQRKELARKDDQQLSATQAYGVIPQADYEERIGRSVVKISMHLEKRKHVEPDDFVISMRSFQGGLERAWARGAIRSSYTVLEPAIKVAPSYFAYLFKCPQYIGALQSTGNFIRDGQDLTYQNYILVDLPLPPFVEQERIGAFLDEKTAQIDALIAKKQRQIELLDEQKAILINRAVTRGLHPNPDLQDSGIPWIGPIPKHWELSMLKRQGRLKGGIGFPHEEQGKSAEELHFYKVSDLSASSDGIHMIASPNMISRKVARRLGAEIFPPSTIVYAKIGAALLLNRRRITREPCCIDNNMTAFIPRRGLNPMWAHLWTTQLDFSKLVNPGPVPSLSEGRQGALPFLVPPRKEQDEIVSHLNELAERFQNLDREIESQIQTLQTLRSTLIAHAVTGKIKV